jgi:excisionase family DNA binding protein
MKTPMLLKLSTLSQRWNVHERTILNWIHQKKLPALKFNGLWRVEATEAERFEQQARESGRKAEYVEF